MATAHTKAQAELVTVNPNDRFINDERPFRTPSANTEAAVASLQEELERDGTFKRNPKAIRVGSLLVIVDGWLRVLASRAARMPIMVEVTEGDMDEAQAAFLKENSGYRELPLSKEDRDRAVIVLINKGWTQRRIGRATGISPTTVKKIADTHGIEMNAERQDENGRKMNVTKIGKRVPPANDDKPLTEEDKRAVRKAILMKYRNRYYTPSWIMDVVRSFFGGTIDLDPASDAEAQLTVKARHYYSPEKGQDGLLSSLPWAKSDGSTGAMIWCNPPYEDVGPWVEKGLREISNGNASDILFLVPVTESRWLKNVLKDHPICIVDKMIHFDRPTALKTDLADVGIKEKLSDTSGWAEAFVYIGPRRAEFVRTFDALGACLVRMTPAAALSVAA